MEEAGIGGMAKAAAQTIAGPIFGYIKNEVEFLCCFGRNVKKLEKEVEDLNDIIRELQLEVDRAKSTNREVVPRVERWLTRASDIKDQTTSILDKVPEVEKGCLQAGARYTLSKRAVKVTRRLKEHNSRATYDVITEQTPIPAASKVPIVSYSFESRRGLEEDIMSCLREGNARLVGICGMGGLGKTTIARRIINSLLDDRVYKEAAMVVLSEKVDYCRTSEDLCGLFGLCGRNTSAYDERVVKLYGRLSEDTKTLIVLDDVWETPDLGKLGIPTDSNGCTVMVTSRNKNILRSLRCEHMYEMEVLSNDDALFLFQEKAGTVVDEPHLSSMAKQIVQECGGLPIALTCVGQTLTNRTSASIWRAALRQLRQSSPDIPDIIASVYNPLKLSYEFLNTQPLKVLFLLCSLFREDKLISVDYLTYLRMAIEGFGNLNSCREDMNFMIKTLLDRSLLLHDSVIGYVNMHDVVCNVCLFIARGEGFISGNGWSWISNFRVLMRRDQYQKEEEDDFEFDSGVPEGIRNFGALFVERSSFEKLPYTVDSLENLKTLVLISCQELRTIDVVCLLVHLKIFVCRECNSLQEIPTEMKALKRLQLLDLTRCKNIKSFPRGIISSLTRLEELKMWNSFRNWEGDDKDERRNAGLKELEVLKKLRCLEIDIDDGALCESNMHLSQKIENFYVRIAEIMDDDHGDKSDNTLILHLGKGIRVGPWIKKFLIDSRCLILCGNGITNFSLARSPHIKTLSLQQSKSVKHLVRTSVNDTVFSVLLSLELRGLPKFQDLCRGPVSRTSFQNLVVITISKCDRLRNLDVLSFSGKLKEVYVNECDMMDHLFVWSGEEMFPELEIGVLLSLPSLESFYEGHGNEGFGLNTKKVHISNCPKFKRTGWGWGSGSESESGPDL